jgi:hypothetical protein
MVFKKVNKYTGEGRGVENRHFKYRPSPTPFPSIRCSCSINKKKLASFLELHI